jgi:tellurite resistance protein TerC
VTGGVVLDLGIGARGVRTRRRAIAWTAGWVLLALAFALGIAVLEGRGEALVFLTGYAMELALSVDNVVVILLIFSSLLVPASRQHRVLFWGVIGAVLLRGLFVAAGAAALARFAWVGPVLGVVVAAGGVRLAARDERATVRGTAGPVLRLARRFLPLTDRYDGNRFLVRERLDGQAGGGAARWVGTPLLLALLLIETTDLLFAVDSIPAVFGVTRDAFVVLTSNIFAVIGLRSLTVILGEAVDRVRYLRYGVAVVLVLIGAKMLLAPVVAIPTGATLAAVAGVLGAAVGASLLYRR